jgi:hypothetical protein
LRADGDDRPVVIMKFSTPDKPLEGHLRDGASWRTGIYVLRTLAEDYSTLAYRLIGNSEEEFT